MNLDEITFWGNFYWKFNNILLEDKFYYKEIIEIFKNYGNRKQHQIPLNNWETCKQEVKEISISYSNIKSKQRKANLKIGKEMLNNGYINNKEVSSRIKNKKRGNKKTFKIKEI